MTAADKVIQRLAPHVVRRELVLFCGAGVSVAAGIHPFPPDVRWRERLSTRRRSDPQFWTWFRSTFGGEDRKPSEQHLLVAHLNARYVITTNYDSLLEEACGAVNAGMSVHVVRRDVDLIGAPDSNVIIKLHGDVHAGDSDLLVITAEDYMRRWRNGSRADAFVRHLFANHPVLFVGYSVSDEHVVQAMMDDMRHAPIADIPPKYVLLSEEARDREPFLTQAGLQPVYLAPDSTGMEAAVRGFLASLWEQRGDLRPFTELMEQRAPTAKEMLERAVLHRQCGEVMQAKGLVDQMKGVLFAPAGLPTDLLSTFLYLTVSVYDKLELWGDLERFNEDTLEPLLASRRPRMSRAVLEAIEASHYASMALMRLRAGKLDEADEALRKVSPWEPSPVAESGLHALHANGLVTRALVLLFRTACGLGPTTELNRAEQLLDQAGRVFESRAADSHYLGRFYGTRAFVRIARSAPSAAGSSAVDLRAWAKAGHTGLNRTSYGRVAGLYCEAFCLYWLQRAGHGDHADLQAARSCVEEALSLLGKGKPMAQAKLRLLAERLTAASSAQPADLRSASVQLPGVLALLTEDQWLRLPLN